MDKDYFDKTTSSPSDSEEDTSAAKSLAERTDAFSDGAFEDYTNKTEGGSDEARYDEIFDRSKPKSLGFSITSMVLGILGVVCCCFGWTGLILGALAIVFSVVSRAKIGYFDGFSIAGLILGIFGVCFGVLFIVFSLVVGTFFEELAEGIERELTEGSTSDDIGGGAFRQLLRIFGK